MILLQLFLSFLQIGAFSIGGGYAAIPLIQDQAVNVYKWISLQQFTDLITIAEMTPGPMAINSATFVGMKMYGIIGALVATFGCIFPSMILVTILAHLYYKYSNLDVMQGVLGSLRPAVVALILGAAISLFLMALWNVASIGEIVLANTDILSAILFVLAFIALRKTKINLILIMFSCGVIYTIINL
ncbi:MAG: chromate transporter, partial [Christensenellaceae bacterium]|nr:chromate transporter [Christensenellaceae bacterium]